MELTAEFMRIRDIVLFTTGTDMAVRIAAIAIPITSSGKLRPTDADFTATLRRRWPAGADESGNSAEVIFIVCVRSSSGTAAEDLVLSACGKVKQKET
jgi:hypothetical protein